jgi:hypothetical protein
MNDMDTDTKIIEILEKNGAVRRRDLIQRLTEDPSDEKQYSLATINRKIRNLKKTGQIVEVEHDRYDFYEIDDQDKNATYFVLKTVNEDCVFIDGILPHLKTKDEDTILTTLNEIEGYRGKYRLNPTQLDSVVLVLDYNITIVRKALWILFYHLHEKHDRQVKPSNIEPLIKKLKSVLSRFCGNRDFNADIHQRCIDILGILKDPTVVNQLKKDAKNLEHLKAVKSHYEGRFTGESIKSQRKILFDFEIELRKTKTDENTQIADIISEIRATAAQTVLNPPKLGGLLS